MNLEDMTLEELKQLRKDVGKAIDTYEARQLAEARAKLEAYAKEMGVKLEDVMGAGTRTRLATCATAHCPGPSRGC